MTTEKPKNPQTLKQNLMIAMDAVRLGLQEYATALEAFNPNNAVNPSIDYATITNDLKEIAGQFSEKIANPLKNIENLIKPFENLSPTPSAV